MRPASFDKRKWSRRRVKLELVHDTDVTVAVVVYAYLNFDARQFRAWGTDEADAVRRVVDNARTFWHSKK